MLFERSHTICGIGEAKYPNAFTHKDFAQIVSILVLIDCRARMIRKDEMARRHGSCKDVKALPLTTLGLEPAYFLRLVR